MVADLIRASAKDISSIRFPNGDMGQVRGFDGVLDAVGAPPYVPDGESIWEFGVNANAATKADSDFEKRTDEVSEEQRQRTTFVFVTPRTWDKPKVKLADWVNEKKKLAQWKDVVYLDGAMVEDWLYRSPAVAARYARFELMLHPATGARSTEEFWNEYSSRFAPQLVEQVLLAGREQQAEVLIQKLSEGVNKIPYAADTPDEVVAFAVAAIRSLIPAARSFLEAKTIVVDTEEAARQLADTSGLIFLPRAQARGLAGYLALKGPTVVSAGADDKKHDHEVLRRPSSTELGKALSGMGFTAEEGYDLARCCGRSLAVLARLKPSSTAPRPEWMESGSQLLPALLAGAWHMSSKSDQEVLCRLAAMNDYAAYEAPLRGLAKLQDPPIDRVADVWALRASVDAFVHLGHLIGSEHLDRFSEVAKIVFGKVLEPPKASEPFKPAAQRTADSHSTWLRDGMMNTLLHMAVLHEQAQFEVAGTTPQEYVNRVVREIPGLSSDHRLLASLQDQLPMLAEAAPIPFIEALECLLEGDAANIRPIFDEHKGFINSHSYHYGILWGLELLAWDPKLLHRVSLCLARLAEIDPGGPVSNRPINSLRAIFLSWAPSTSATAAQRNGVLTQVLDSSPAIAWSLITKLLPSAYDTSGPTQRPVFREFGERNPEILTYGKIWQSQSFVVDLAIRHAGHDPWRWVIIINAISHFPEQAFMATTMALNTVLASATADDHFLIWNTLLKEVSRHRRYADANWALPEQKLLQLDSLIQTFAPTSEVARSIWLFDDWPPNVTGITNTDIDPKKAIATARLDAIRRVINESGTAGLIELAGRAKLPQHVAYAARGLSLDFDALGDFFTQATHAGQKLDVVTGVILAEGVLRFDTKWMAFVKGVLTSEKITPERIAGLLMMLDESMATWNYVRTFGDEVNDLYWQRKHSSFITGSVEDLLFAVDNYLVRQRPLAALDSATHRMADLPTKKLLILLDESVAEINATGPTGGAKTLYDIELAFEELRKRTDTKPAEIAAMEFRYLPALHHREKPLLLHALIMKQPQLFMEVICAVFKPANGESKPSTESTKSLATSAYRLLTDIHVVPGQSDDDIDEQMLFDWCMEVRGIATEVDREKITDQRIGAVLAHSPASKKDDAWPHEAVRIVIEKLRSNEIERGVAIERFNMRGVYSKAIGEGGDQERALERQYRKWADTMPESPRTAALLMGIADGWLHEAKRADLSAQKEALRG